MTTTVTISAGGECYPVKYQAVKADGTVTAEGFVPGNFTKANIYVPSDSKLVIEEVYVQGGYVPALPAVENTNDKS